MKHSKVLLLGSGALTIGQAGEFDYSGSQAIQAFLDEGMQVIVVNPNIATVQTNPKENVSIYLYPITAEWVQKIIEKERPDCIAAGFGGQTAISCLINLEKLGILSQYNINVLGSSITTLHLTEDRGLFASEMMKIDIPIVKSKTADSVENAVAVAEMVGYPVIVRAAYTLGGLGSGFANNRNELEDLARKSFAFSPQVLIEASLRGWKEVEYEVMRDVYGNTICICNMENFDPLGVHTGDSIVISPSQTLTNDDYQLLRDSSIKIAKHLNIIGECNVQYALSPDSKSFFVIEVNARLSRSSALASKATGYPIALLAAKIVLGHSLVELKNPLTLKTSAFFEPSLDYVAIKFPSWDLAKFEGLSNEIGSTMKSIGEIMALGRNFPEAYQKAVRMVKNNELGIFSLSFENSTDEALLERLKSPCTERSFIICELFYRNKTTEEIYHASRITPWFLNEIARIIKIAKDIEEASEIVFECLNGGTNPLLADNLLNWKKLGFSDHQIIYLISRKRKIKVDKANIKLLREFRKKRNIIPKIKKIDTSSGEFPTSSNYLYLTYHGDFNDILPIEKSKDAAIILGSGSYKIGSSVEFDWAAVSTSLELKKQGVESIVINCNPETVSTDFNVSSRLYFEELSTERVLDIYEFENSLGVIACVGGQVANNLIHSLTEAGVSILGHQNETLNLTENRVVFSELLNKEKIDQPRWTSASNKSDIIHFVEEVGFPILIRPSFVLSGANMKVVYNSNDLDIYLNKAIASTEHPIILTRFISGAKEIEIDGVALNGEVLLSFISEHVECAGVHSGDATIIYPSQRLYSKTIKTIEENTKKIVLACKLNGPFNIQYLALDNDVMVIECNARASRTLPFIKKVSGIDIIEKCTSVFLSKKMTRLENNSKLIKKVGVKAAMFSFNRQQELRFEILLDTLLQWILLIGEKTYNGILKMKFEQRFTQCFGSKEFLQMRSFSMRS